ncbi:MAG: amidohydrolase family protein, partial [Pseudomonadota bacterium]
VDGSGTVPRPGCVGVRSNTIVHIGPPCELASQETIDATGLVVSPGFIDPHTHADDDLDSNNEAYLRQGVTTLFIGNDGGGGTVKAARQHLDKHGVSTNVGLFSGHGAVRESVMGYENRAPTESELDQMKALVKADMEAGSLGLSSGLFYAPGSYANTDELVELARVAAKYNGIYDSHIRDEGNYNINVGLLGSIRELIDIAEQANIPGHIAHIKALGPAVHGQSHRVISLVEKARKQGVIITADQYPWLASGTRLSNALLPRSVMEGGKQQMHKRLNDIAYVESIRAQIEQNLVRRGGATALLITGQSAHQGKTLEEAANTLQLDTIKTAISIVLEGDPAVASFMMAESDVKNYMVRPWVVTGSDGSTGHPRKFGTFPHKYQRYVVEEKVLTMAHFVENSSARTAQIFGLCRRGTLQKAMAADIAIWDPVNFRAEATYQKPTEPAVGVIHLMVNGQWAIRNSQLTEIRAGTVINLTECSSE